MAGESELQKDILQWLWYNKIYSWRNNSGAYKTDGGRWIKYGRVGSADIIGVLEGGQFLAIECKSEKGKLTEHQKLFLANIKANGGVAFVARSIQDVVDNIGLDT